MATIFIAILNILRLRDGPNKSDCVDDIIVMAILLKAGQELGSVAQGAAVCRSRRGFDDSNVFENRWK